MAADADAGNKNKNETRQPGELDAERNPGGRKASREAGCRGLSDQVSIDQSSAKASLGFVF